MTSYQGNGRNDVQANFFRELGKFTNVILQARLLAECFERLGHTEVARGMLSLHTQSSRGMPSLNTEGSRGMLSLGTEG